MEKTKLLTLAIVSLLILNVGTLLFLVFRRPPPPHEGRRDNGGEAREFLMRELKMDDAQRKTFDLLREKHHITNDSLVEQMKLVRERVFDNFKTGDTTGIAQVSFLQQQIELNTFSHFRDVRAALRNEQQVHFDEIIREAMRMMSPKPPPPRRN